MELADKESKMSEYKDASDIADKAKEKLERLQTKFDRYRLKFKFQIESKLKSQKISKFNPIRILNKNKNKLK